MKFGGLIISQPIQDSWTAYLQKLSLVLNVPSSCKKDLAKFHDVGNPNADTPAEITSKALTLALPFVHSFSSHS